MDAPKNHLFKEDRHLHCQAAIDPMLRALIDKANMNGWGSIETMDAIEEVMKNLRIAYAEDPDPAEDQPIADSGDANDFGEFPSAERLIKAFVEEREKP
jgi:hypothetical protein